MGFCRELQETVAWMKKKGRNSRAEKPKNESTEAKNCDGTACSSYEVSVMEIEQRSSVKRVLVINQLVERMK